MSLDVTCQGRGYEGQSQIKRITSQHYDQNSIREPPAGSLLRDIDENKPVGSKNERWIPLGECAQNAR